MGLFDGLINKSSVMGALDSGFTVLLIIIILLVLGGLGYYIYWIKQFKHKFRIKQVTHGRKIIIDDKARELKGKDGGLYWQLFKSKDKLTIPPVEAIELDHKGRKCVEAYKLETGDYIYSKDLNDAKEIPESLLKIENLTERKNKIKSWVQENNVIHSKEPLTTTQRMILINQIVKAQLKKTKTWQDYLLPVAALGSVVIIVVSLMIFYGDMAKPLLNMADKTNKNEELHLKQWQIIQEIERDVQIIKSEVKPSDKKSPPS